MIYITNTVLKKIKLNILQQYQIETVIILFEIHFYIIIYQSSL
jgi:hypothetical protein